MSDFFNELYYYGRLRCRSVDTGSFKPGYKTVLGFLRTVSGNESLSMNSVIFNLTAREGLSGHSATLCQCKIQYIIGTQSPYE